jgi:hypothetical protein
MKEISKNEISSKYDGMTVRITTISGSITGVFRSIHSLVPASLNGAGITKKFNICDENGINHEIFTELLLSFTILSD